MSKSHTEGAYGTLVEPATLKIERLLPGPIERVWDYLTKSDLRGKWLASGVMELTVGASFELVWRNSELTDPPGKRPDGFGDEHRAQCRILELDPPRKLVYTWPDVGEVSFVLKSTGDDVLLSLTHSRLPNRKTTVMVSAGWHAHLDVLVARVNGTEPQPHWDNWVRLREDYEQRLPA